MHKRHTIVKMDREEVARDKKNREVAIFSEQEPQLPGCQNRDRDRDDGVWSVRCIAYHLYPPISKGSVENRLFAASKKNLCTRHCKPHQMYRNWRTCVAYFVTSKPYIVGERIRVANTVTRASSLCAHGVAESPYVVTTRQHCTFRHGVGHRVRCKNVLWVGCRFSRRRMFHASFTNRSSAMSMQRLAYEVESKTMMLTLFDDGVSTRNARGVFEEYGLGFLLGLASRSESKTETTCRARCIQDIRIPPFVGRRWKRKNALRNVRRSKGHGEGRCPVNRSRVLCVGSLTESALLVGQMV